MAKGLYDKAGEILKECIAEFPDHPWAYMVSAMNYVVQHKYDLALSEIDRAISLNPQFFWSYLVKGHIHHSRGDWIKAGNSYTKLLELEELASQLLGRRFLGGLYLSQGKFAESKEQLKRGMELAKKIGEKEREFDFHVELGYWYLNSGQHERALREFEEAEKGYKETDALWGQRYALFTQSLTYIKMRSLPEAQRLAEEFKGMVEKGMNQKEMRLYHQLVGRIELEREDFSKAIENFKKAISLLPKEHDYFREEQALFIEPLAIAYYKAGDLEKAREEYLKIIQLTSGRLLFGDIYAKSFYMLGKICAQIGWRGKAIEHYAKFLDLWKDADPGIPEIEDAKNRLASLKS
jgi:tetratricopeptide (TPR) repeat protein